MASHPGWPGTVWFSKMASDTKNMGGPRQMEVVGNQHTASDIFYFVIRCFISFKIWVSQDDLKMKFPKNIQVYVCFLKYFRTSGHSGTCILSGEKLIRAKCWPSCPFKTTHVLFLSSQSHPDAFIHFYYLSRLWGMRLHIRNTWVAYTIPILWLHPRPTT